MKILDIIVAVNSGFTKITCNDLSASSKYKVLKFKTILNKAFEYIQSLEKSLLEACDIQDIQDIDSKIKKFEANKNRTEEENEEYKNLSNKMDSYLKIRTEMLQDDLTLNDISTISYEDWYTLRKENRDKDYISNYIEDALKGVFWVEPDE